MANEIQLYLFSGFLGAGKTTLLRNILQDFSAYKVGILVNEFGSVGIDGEMLPNEGVDLVEINNGSIFCMCLKAGFLKALQDFSKTPIDVLFIENSGLGDPSSVYKILAEVKPYLERQYNYRGAVCVVDCTTYPEYSDILPPVENQVRTSHIILLNKTDLADDERIEKVQTMVKEVNPEAFIYRTSYSRLPVNILIDDLLPSAFSGESSNKDWNRPAVYVVRGLDPVGKEQLHAMISAVMQKAVRVKGFIRSADGWWHVDAAGKQVSLTEMASVDQKKAWLVMIGKNKEPFLDLVQTEWAEKIGTVPEIRIE